MASPFRDTPDRPPSKENAIDPYLLPVKPSTPDIGMEDADVESMDISYSIRGPEDWVLGGPLGLEMVESNKPGRWFETWDEAEVWARELHGNKVKGRKEPGPGDTRSWAFIIQGPRGA